MTHSLNRRDFLVQSVQFAAGLGLAGSLGMSAFAADKKPLYQISLAQWSLNDTIFGGKLDNLDFAKVAKKEFGIEAIEYVNPFFKAKLDQARINLGYTEIRAPIAGRISRANFSVGNFVGPGSGVLARIVSQDPIYVTFPVSQRELLAHRDEVGTPVVKVTLPDGTHYEYPGKLNFLDIRVDPGTDTLTVRAEMPNPDRTLIDGQFVGVRVERGTPRQMLAVSQAAVQVDQAGPYVLVVGADDKVEERRVKLGLAEGVQVVVEGGLNEGDRVIVEGIQKVRPGMAVAVSEAEPARTAGQTALQPQGPGRASPQARRSFPGAVRSSASSSRA
jgi:multidrug efflux pump subunit AcrA (membrane-fusion protein)